MPLDILTYTYCGRQGCTGHVPLDRIAGDAETIPDMPTDAEIDASNAAAAVRRTAWPELTEGIALEIDDR